MLLGQQDVQLLPETAELMWGFIAFLALMGVLVGLSMYAAKDMSRRGDNGLLHGLLVFFVPPVGLLVWLVMRARLKERTAASESQAT